MVLGDVRVVLIKCVSKFLVVILMIHKSKGRSAYHCLFQVLCFPYHTVSSLAKACIFRRGVLSR